VPAHRLLIALIPSTLLAVDAQPPTVVGVVQSPQSGSTVSQAPTSIAIAFSEAIAASQVNGVTVRLIGSGGDFNDNDE
jgi:hypothetical protein